MVHCGRKLKSKYNRSGDYIYGFLLDIKQEGRPEQLARQSNLDVYLIKSGRERTLFTVRFHWVPKRTLPIAMSVDFRRIFGLLRDILSYVRRLDSA